MPYGGRGYRWMYYATGLPGWIRFGFSPGWGGLPPAANYLIQSGQLPQFMSFLQQRTIGLGPMQGIQQFPQMTKEQELKFLEQQASILEQQLNEIKKRIDELK